MGNAGVAGRAVVAVTAAWTWLVGMGCTQSFRSASLEQQIEAFKQTTGHLADLAARTDAAYRAEFEYDGSEAEAYVKQSAGLRVPIRIRLGVFGNAKGDRPTGGIGSAVGKGLATGHPTTEGPQPVGRGAGSESNGGRGDASSGNETVGQDGDVGGGAGGAADGFHELREPAGEPVAGAGSGD